MKRATKFSFSPSWQVLLKDMEIDIPLAVKLAGLPLDILTREKPTLTSEQYFRFMEAISLAAPHKDVPLLVAKHLSTEAFDPACFASLCSKNFTQAVKRIANYKPLIGPMFLNIIEDSDRTKIEIHCYGVDDLPRDVALCELTFFTQLFRIATRHDIIPLHVTTPKLPKDTTAYQDYFGCSIEEANTVSLTFSAPDMAKPFATQNNQMWQYFEGQLNQRLENLNQDATTSQKVKGVLLEAIPSGDYSVDTVAMQLHMSKRTLQRKLSLEKANFKDILQEVRIELADHYLEKSTLPLGEISFLLGFHEANSFIRAYQHWKGVSPGSYREQHH